jgi:hypothetical protein
MSSGVAVGRLNFQFRHQEQVEHTVALVGIEDDYCPTRGRLGHEVSMHNIERPSVCHANREGAEWDLMQRLAELVGRHTAILSPRSGIATNARFGLRLASDLLSMAIQKSLGGGEGFGVFEIPHAACFGASCGHRKIGNRLPESPVGMLLAQLGECGEKFFPCFIGLHSFSPTVGNEATAVGMSSITSTVTIAPGT